MASHGHRAEEAHLATERHIKGASFTCPSPTMESYHSPWLLCMIS